MVLPSTWRGAKEGKKAWTHDCKPARVTQATSLLLQPAPVTSFSSRRPFRTPLTAHPMPAYLMLGMCENSKPLYQCSSRAPALGGEMLMKIAAKDLELEGPALHDSEACSVHRARLLKVPAGAPAATSLVALKLIKISNTAAFDRFERERAVLQRADHPCIVKPLFIIEVRVSDGPSPRASSRPDALLGALILSCTLWAGRAELWTGVAFGGARKPERHDALRRPRTSAQGVGAVFRRRSGGCAGLCARHAGDASPRHQARERCGRLRRQGRPH